MYKVHEYNSGVLLHNCVLLQQSENERCSVLRRVQHSVLSL